MKVLCIKNMTIANRVVGSRGLSPPLYGRESPLYMPFVLVSQVIFYH